MARQNPYEVNFDITTPDTRNDQGDHDETDERPKNSELPVDEPDVQIVPHGDVDQKRDTENERGVIYDILNNPDVELPWVQPSKKKERGQA